MEGQNFLLHAGSRPATFEELGAVTLPQDHEQFKDAVGKYKTLRHDVLVNHIRNTITTFISPTALLSEHYALSTAPKYPGAKMFGMMKIDLGDSAAEAAAALALEFANDTVNEEPDLDRDPDEVDDPEDTRDYRDALNGLEDTVAEKVDFEEDKDWGQNAVSVKPDSITPALFFRNSYDKSMSMTTAFGYQVFACDNLAVSGDLQYRRKHTKNMLRDVIATISIMVQTAGRQHAFDMECKRALSEMEISNEEGYRILGEMAGIGALNIANGTKSQFATALLEWNDPTFQCFKDRTMWSLYNAVTFALRVSGINKRLENASAAHSRFLSFLDERYSREAMEINAEFAEAIS